MLIVCTVVAVGRLSVHILLIRRYILIVSCVVLILSVLLIVLIILRILSAVGILTVTVLPRLSVGVRIRILILLIRRNIFSRICIVCRILIVVAENIITVRCVAVLRLNILSLFFLCFGFGNGNCLFRVHIIVLYGLFGERLLRFKPTHIVVVKIVHKSYSYIYLLPLGTSCVCP